MLVLRTGGVRNPCARPTVDGSSMVEAGSEPNLSDSLKEIGVITFANSAGVVIAYDAATIRREGAIFWCPNLCSARGGLFCGDDRLEGAIAWHGQASWGNPAVAGGRKALAVQAFRQRSERKLDGAHCLALPRKGGGAARKPGQAPPAGPNQHRAVPRVGEALKLGHSRDPDDRRHLAGAAGPGFTAVRSWGLCLTTKFAGELSLNRTCNWGSRNGKHHASCRPIRSHHRGRASDCSRAKRALRNGGRKS